MMESKILIVDGSNLLFQMFFGMPARIYNDDGIGIWGVLGFIGALLKIIRQIAPTHMVVLFDGENNNERLAIDKNYKSNRPDYSQFPAEENPYSQLPYIQKALRHMGIPYAETTDCEVDDWVAGYVYRYREHHKLVISSFDSDFFQLIHENVSVLRYRGKNSYFCDVSYLRERFGICSEQYAAFKSLLGDTADNIKGVDGVGPKRAAALLHTFGSLEGILANVEKINSPSVKSVIQENRERLRRNYRLIKLEGGAALPFPLEEMAVSEIEMTTMEVMRGIGLSR